MHKLGVMSYEIKGLEKLNRPNQLVLANHPTLIDIVFLISRMPFAGCIVKEKLWHNPFIKASVINAGLITIAILILQFTLSVFEPLELLSPFALSSFWTNILTNPLFEWNVNILSKLFFLIIWAIIPLIGTLYSMKKRDI